MLPLTLAYDHRVIDGAVGGRFMALLRDKIAQPSSLSP
jgi:pyruvate/2-oxoglutarate dehydrogenase complex dihydrolipoamide acyltransferase (E2) component